MKPRLRFLPAIANPSNGISGSAALNNPSDSKLLAMQFRRYMTRLAFWIFVIAPTLAATAFYGLVAVPRYASEARFIVRSVSTPQTSGIDILFRTIGVAKTADDAYLIQKYLLSRDAIDDLEKEGVDLKQMFMRNDIDRLSRYPRFWRADTKESLYDFYLDHILVTEDEVKGIVQLRVVAFRPDDAQLVTLKLLHLAETLVNHMNERAQADSLESSRQDVALAEDKVIKAQSDITGFRNREVLIDPSKSGISLIETIGELSTELSQQQAQLAETLKLSPQNPAIKSLKQRIIALQDRVAVERARMAGNDASLATKVAAYEQLALRRDIADKTLSASLNSLESARQEALRQHIYVEELVQPNLPDESTEPERIRSILTVFALGFAVFAVLWIISVGAGEHSQ